MLYDTIQELWTICTRGGKLACPESDEGPPKIVPFLIGFVLLVRPPI